MNRPTYRPRRYSDTMPMAKHGRRFEDFRYPEPIAPPMTAKRAAVIGIVWVACLFLSLAAVRWIG